MGKAEGETHIEYLLSRNLCNMAHLISRAQRALGIMVDQANCDLDNDQPVNRRAFVFTCLALQHLARCCTEFTRQARVTFPAVGGPAKRQPSEAAMRRLEEDLKFISAHGPKLEKWQVPSLDQA